MKQKRMENDNYNCRRSVLSAAKSNQYLTLKTQQQKTQHPGGVILTIDSMVSNNFF